MATEHETLSAFLLSERVQSVVVLGCVLALCVQSFYAVTVPPATGFETSVVTAYPLVFWVAFYGVVAGAIVVLVAAAITRSSVWRHALAVLACDYALFIFLPSFRGYHLYGRGASDVLGHYSYVKEILATGHFPDSLWYPAQHILAAEVVRLGVPLSPTKYLLSFVLTVVYLVSVGLLVREVTRRHTAFLAGLAAAVPLVFTYFHVTLHPFMLSFMLLPTVLACAERHRWTGSREHFLFASLTLLLMVFFHPVTGFFTIVFLAVTAAVTRLYRRTQSADLPPFRSTLLLLFVPVWGLWYGSLEKTQSEVYGVVDALSAGAPGGASVEASNAAEAALTPTQLAIRFVELYGTVFFYAAAAGLFATAIVVTFWRRRGRFAEGYAVMHFAVGAFLALGFLLTYLVAVGPIRVTRYMVMAATVVVALVLERGIRGDVPYDAHDVLTVAVTLLVVSVAVLGANATYWPNKHMTETEYQGTEFMLANDRADVPIRAHETSWKMSAYVVGRFDSYPRSFHSTDPDYQLAPHLGYANGSSAATTFGHSYLTTKTFDRTYHTARYFFPRQRRALFLYDARDLRRMRADPTVQRVYANGGFSGWYVPPTADERAETDG